MKFTALVLSVLMASNAMAQSQGDNSNVKQFLSQKKQEINSDLMKTYTLKRALDEARLTFRKAQGVDRQVEAATTSSYVLVPSIVVTSLGVAYVAADVIDGDYVSKISKTTIKIGGIPLVLSGIVYAGSKAYMKMTEREIDSLEAQIAMIQSGMQQRLLDLNQIETGIK